MHRLTLAKYFGRQYLYADVYSGNGSFYSDEGVGGSVFLQEGDLEKYYETKDINYIKATYRELKNINNCVAE